nr:Chain C, USP1 C-END DEGRON [Homo sapiens]6DO5_D Chain D, USP1 C-END DEGRON [Homo sapiens]
IGLLGG